MDIRDLKEGQEVYVKGRVIHTGDHLDIVLDEGSFIENAIVLHYEKPFVPQFVADWIERRRERREYSLLDAMHLTAQSEDFRKWIMSSKHQEVFARSWIFGYEVENEKRYLVKIKATGQCLGKYYINNEVLSPRFTYTGRNADAFTRKELEDAGFGEVFNSSLFAIEEVE